MTSEPRSRRSVAATDRDRRASARKQLDARLRLRIDGGATQEARLVDVSDGGAQVEFLAGELLPRPGQRVVIQLSPEGARPTAPRAGEIIWSGSESGPRFGLRFLAEEVAPEEAPDRINIERVKVNPRVAMRFPAARARRWQVLPFAESEDTVVVAAADSFLGQARTPLDRLYRKDVEVQVVDADALRRVIERVYAGADGLTTDGDRRPQPESDEGDELGSGAVALYDQMFASAIMYGASDVHIDSFEDHVRMRARVDGQIEHLRDLGVENGVSLISRIKVMAGLDISERRAPQDGRLQHETSNGVKVQVRVATLPTKHGERVTLRLLAQDSGHITLEDLGMSKVQLEQFGRAIRQPHGLILLTGPTGSGKSTTLNAALRQLVAESDLNVITIEDPIEYQIPGVTQVEVDPAEKVTFPKALRSTLRHDPDVVMVGEIRDSETADIAVKAALTGHLVLSTLHTNDASGAITRLTDMGVPPFLVAATLRLVVAQRLVRRLCTSCATVAPCDPVQAAALGRSDLSGMAIKEPAGCLYCGERGYTGRLALFEMLTSDQELSQLIAGHASEGEIKAHLHERGAPSLEDDAAEKLLNGETSMAEVLRNVTRFMESPGARSAEVDHTNNGVGPAGASLDGRDDSR
ncbi:MAG: ATPase, T2SS/T4P/T4SS family [Planctomycetota bacterium]